MYQSGAISRALAGTCGMCVTHVLHHIFDNKFVVNHLPAAARGVILHPISHMAPRL